MVTQSRADGRGRAAIVRHAKFAARDEHGRGNRSSIKIQDPRFDVPDVPPMKSDIESKGRRSGSPQDAEFFNWSAPIGSSAQPSDSARQIRCYETTADDNVALSDPSTSASALLNRRHWSPTEEECVPAYEPSSSSVWQRDESAQCFKSDTKARDKASSGSKMQSWYQESAAGDAGPSGLGHRSLASGIHSTASRSDLSSTVEPPRGLSAAETGESVIPGIQDSLPVT